MPDIQAVRAFLEPHHLDLATAWRQRAAEEIGTLAHPADDSAARVQARELLPLLGNAGWFAPSAEGDLRGGVLARETLAFESPLADAVFALQVLGSMPIRLGADPEQIRSFVEPALGGTLMAAFAMTEPEAGSDVASMQTLAEREADGYRIRGVKTLISNAGIADFYTVLAKTNPEAGHRGISCFIVPADTPGVRFVRPLVMSEPHPLGELAFDCLIPQRFRVGAEGEGFKLGLASLDRLRATVGAAACGMAERALSEALQHATTRRQFGKPLAEFQLIQQKLARMATELTASRLLVYRAAWESDRGAERVTLEAAMAKLYATEAAQRIIDDAVQIIGGRGALCDHPVDRLYRAVRSLRIYEGTSEIQQLVIARQWLKRHTTG